mgnify:CR=1 FL=1
MNLVKIQNPGKEYPSKMGQKWTDEEESLLLEELNKNMDIETISQTHNRTIGGINARLRDIAYKMYLKNISMEEIIKKTKLNPEYIRQTIEKKQNNNSKKIAEVKNQVIAVDIKKNISIENEITEMKNEIKSLKNTIQELVEMMKAVYEFEDV